MNRVGDTLLHFGSNEELVSALLDAGVKFVVVGGLAVAWYCSTRSADDMDLLVEPSSENSARIANALTKLGCTGYTSESFTTVGLQVPLKARFYAELLTPQQDALQFSEVESSAVDARLFSMPVRLASISTLLQMKRRAVKATGENMEKHLNDIKLLEQYDRLVQRVCSQ